MKVVRLHAAGDLRLHDEPAPTPRADEALVRVTAVGICGSDLHWLNEGTTGGVSLTRAIVLGHEFAGTLENGERVAVEPAVACNECEFCRQGNPNLCINLHFAGDVSRDGALREYVNAPLRCLFRLPDSISDGEGALLEPLGVAMHAVNLAHLQPGMMVGIFGAGPIGLLLTQLVRHAGATRIIVTDKLAHRLDAARAFGATDVIPADGDENAAIWATAERRGVDVAFEAAGGNDAVNTAVETVKPGGKVILVGIPSDDRTTFTASIARRKGLTIKLSRRTKHTYPRAIELTQRGMVDLRALVTQSFPLDEFARAFDSASRRVGLKVIIEP